MCLIICSYQVQYLQYLIEVFPKHLNIDDMFQNPVYYVTNGESDDLFLGWPVEHSDQLFMTKRVPKGKLKQHIQKQTP